MFEPVDAADCHENAEALFIVKPEKLRAERRRGLAPDELHGGLQRVAGLERVGEQVQGIGELQFELALALPLPSP